jgi:hypothetical protein
MRVAVTTYFILLYSHTPVPTHFPRKTHHLTHLVPQVPRMPSERTHPAVGHDRALRERQRHLHLRRKDSVEEPAKEGGGVGDWADQRLYVLD